MRLRAVLTGLAALCAGMSLMIVHKTTCKFYPTPGQLSDLPSLISLLRGWEIHTADPGIGHVADHVVKLMDLEQAQQAKKSEAPAADATLKALAIAGLQCNVAYNQEFWGAPLVWGDSHKTDSVAECCAACHAHRATAARGGLDHGPNSTTCNTWVFCGDAERCGARLGECWLKHLEPLPPADAPRPTGTVMWTSGHVFDDVALAGAYGKYGKLTLHTPVGDLVITLLPQYAPDVVRELRREVLTMMSATGGSCGGCKLYRAEDFGIQGIILTPGGYIGTPNTVPNSAPMKKIPPGYVCRAGFGGSAHFFINFFESDWGDALCWGKVEDLTLSKAISKRPLRAKQKPEELSMLAEELYFTISLST